MVQITKGKTLVVCATCPYSSIQSAIDAAQPFDTVLVKKATYKECNIKIIKPLALIGENFPTIDGENKGEIITVNADSVTVSGLFIINVGTSYTTDFAAIRFVKSKYFTVENVVLEKLFFGIYLGEI